MPVRDSFHRLVNDTFNLALDTQAGFTISFFEQLKSKENPSPADIDRLVCIIHTLNPNVVCITSQEELDAESRVVYFSKQIHITSPKAREWIQIWHQVTQTSPNVDITQPFYVSLASNPLSVDQDQISGIEFLHEETRNFIETFDPQVFAGIYAAVYGNVRCNRSTLLIPELSSVLGWRLDSSERIESLVNSYSDNVLSDNFSLFGALFNAPIGTRYEQGIHKHKDQILPPRIIEKPMYANSVDDLIIYPIGHVYMFGCKFLSIESFVMLQHLLLSLGLVDAASAASKLKTIQRSLSTQPAPRPYPNQQMYFDYLGLTGDLSVPISGAEIWIKIPKARPDVVLQMRKFISVSMLSGIKIDTDVDYTKNTVNGIASYSYKQDALLAIADNQQKIHRNVSLDELPPEIQTVYGRVDSNWIWILTKYGKIDIALLTNGLQLGITHETLGYLQGEIVAFGDLQSTQTELVYSYTSGSMSVVTTLDLRMRYNNVVNSLLAINSRFKKTLLFRDSPRSEPLVNSASRRELEYYCQPQVYNTRIYKNLPELPQTESSVGFDRLKSIARDVRACNTRDVLQLVRPNKPASRTDLIQLPMNLDQFIIDLYLYNQSTAFNLNAYNPIQRLSRLPLSNRWMKNIKVLSSTEKSSASSTVIVFFNADYSLEYGKGYTSKSKNIVNNYVALKAGYPSVNLQKDNSLEIEAVIYKHITDRIISKRICPHFPVHYANVQRPTAEIEALGATLDGGGVRPKSSVVNCVLTERMYGGKLYDFFRQYIETFTVGDFKALLFQIIWALITLHESGAQHNDLHTGNIYIIRLNRPTYYVYVDADKIYRVACRYTIKIYDFDQGTLKDVPNTYIENDYFAQYAIYNTLNKHSDIHKVLCGLNLIFRSTIARKQGQTNAVLLKKVLDTFAGKIMRKPEILDNDIRDMNCNLCNALADQGVTRCPRHGEPDLSRFYRADLDDILRIVGHSYLSDASRFDPTYLPMDKNELDYWNKLESMNVPWSNLYRGNIYRRKDTTSIKKLLQTAEDFPIETLEIGDPNLWPNPETLLE